MTDLSRGAGASAASPPDPAGRRRAVTVYMLAILTLASFFNYMDRMVLAVLLQPIKTELRLSDAALGLLSGLAFAALYATLGLPLARIADRSSRVKMLAVCLGLWSVMTTATGIARSFPQLFLARMGVGVGEAGCVPAAHSLIGDILPPDRRAVGISLFQAGGLAGASAGLLIAGFLAGHFGWRVALVCVGLSGLPLGLLIALTFREPLRRGHDPALKSETAMAAMMALLRRPAFVHLVVAISLGGFGNYGIAQWLPTFYRRSFGLSLAQVGLWTGISTGVGGIIGMMCGGIVATRLMRRDARWELWLPGIAYGAAAPAYALVFLSATPWSALAVNAVATFLVASGGGVALSALQSFAEPRRRATAIALSLFLSSLVGLGLGPLLIGLASDALAPSLGDESLRYALLGSSLSLAWAAIHFQRAAHSATIDRVSLEPPMVPVPKAA